MLSNENFRMTRQRQVILQAVKSVHSRPTADEVYQIVRQQLPRMSLGTVYRNLEMLCECGMLRKIQQAGTQKRFDGTVENHYHLRCIRCGRVEDAPIEPLTTIEEVLRKQSDYEIIGHQLQFVGICPQCKNEPPQTAQEPLEKESA